MYDLIIIGSGPAGFGASIYASRYKLKHAVIGEEIGGQVVKASRIENWAGYESISGADLMEKFRLQAEHLGAEIIQGTADKLTKKNGYFEVMCENLGKTFEAKNLIFALGMRPRKMEIPGEEELVGKGVSYCATCDAMFFRNKNVAVIGGGDSAATAALHAAEFANKVYLISRKEDVRIEPSWMDKIDQNQKIEKISMECVLEIIGEQKVNGLKFECDNEEKEISVDGVFIEIGSVPGVGIAKEIGVELDEQEYIKVNADQSTNIENVYAAGDVTTGSNKFRQIITAVAEGSVAAGSVYKKMKMSKD
jgi:thioredoxin reductase (NADPH)